MTNKKTAKRAFLLSLVALVLCFTMLLGTTYAWFTDSVTSGSNVIKSGTLDVTMEWADGTKAVPADDSTEWKDASTGAIFNYELWEPGYTEVRHIKIANEGTLALKYQLNIIANGEVTDLADVIDVYYLDPAQQVGDRTALTADKKLGTLTDVLANISTTASGNLPAGEYHTITLALKMQETAGDEYQNLSIGTDFSIQLFATQYTYEKDSFGKDYDEGAKLPVVESALSQSELKAAIESGADIVYLGSDTYTLPASKNNAFTLIGNGNTVIDLAKAYGQSLSGTDITFENLTVKGDNANYHGIQHAGNIVYNNVVFNESTTLYGESVTFNDCTFNLSTRYIWTYSAKEVTFNNCLFNTDGKAVLVYGENSVDSQVVNFNDCTFAATATAYTGDGDACAAVEIDGSLIKGTYTVNFNGTNTISNKFNGISRIKKQKDPANVTVNQNGTVVTAETVCVATQDDLKNAIASGDTVNVTLAAGTYKLPTTTNKEVTISGTKDTVIDLSNGTGQMQNMSFVFDGVTIKGATVNYKGIVHASSVAYKNCTLTGIQFLYADTVTFENCDFDAEAEEHCIWTYGSKNVSFVDCDFTYGDRCVNIYTESADVKAELANVSFTNCTFNTANTTSKGAVEVNSGAFTNKVNVSFTDCTAPANGDMVGISSYDSTAGANATITVGTDKITAPQWKK